MSLGEQVEAAYKLIGQTVEGLEVKSVKVVPKGQKTSNLVNTYLETHDFCVALCSVSSTIPFATVPDKVESKRIKLTNDYDVVIHKDKIVVSDQTIPIEKVKELLEEAIKLQ